MAENMLSTRRFIFYHPCEAIHVYSGGLLKIAFNVTLLLQTKSYFITLKKYEFIGATFKLKLIEYNWKIRLIKCTAILFLYILHNWN